LGKSWVNIRISFRNTQIYSQKKSFGEIKENMEFATSPAKVSLFLESPEDSKKQILSQVEFYLSDANLPNDHFILSNLDYEGYLSLGLLSTFPKIRRLGFSIQQIANALHESRMLVVDPTGTKVRRRFPLYVYAPEMQTEHMEKFQPIPSSNEPKGKRIPKQKKNESPVVSPSTNQDTLTYFAKERKRTKSKNQDPMTWEPAPSPPKSRLAPRKDIPLPIVSPIRQPKGPDGTKGFAIPRTVKVA